MAELVLDRPGPAVPTRIWGPELRVLTVGLVSTVTLVASEAQAVTTIAPTMTADLGGLSLYGWVTGAFFLTTVIGLVLSGSAMDRIGPVRPFLAGLALFGLGLAVAATAATMYLVIVGRALQGAGNGAITTVVFGMIGRAYPRELRPKVFAVNSTAWLLPSLCGPSVAAFVAEGVGWRWVFGGLIPLVALAGGIAAHALRRRGQLPGAGDGQRAQDHAPDGTGSAAVDRGGDGNQLVLALRLAVGATLALAGLTARSPLGIPGVAAGLLLGVGPLRRLLPAGTLRARPGAPAAVATRGLLAFAFFGAETFVPLTIATVRHEPVSITGVAVTAAAIMWTFGSWTQARLASGRSGRFLAIVGVSVVVVGIAGAGTLLLIPAVPVAAGIVAYALAGFGIGLCYSPIMNVVLNAAPPGRQGNASSAVSLSDNLGVAFGAGLGGVVVAAASHGAGGAGHPAGAQTASATGLAVAFALATTVGLAGVLAARRLPTTILASSAQPTTAAPSA
jgi:MFS family permease